MSDFSEGQEIEAIFVFSEYEGNTFEHAVSTMQDAQTVRDLKIADHAENVRIVLRMFDGSFQTVS